MVIRSRHFSHLTAFILTILAVFLLHTGILHAERPVRQLQAKTSQKTEEKNPLSLEIISSVMQNYNYDLSPDGRNLLYVNDRYGFSTIFRMSSEGGVSTQITGMLKSFSSPQWSPDGKRIACVSSDQIWIMDADGRNPKQLTTHGAPSDTPRWSPDGKSIAYYSRRRGWDQVWITDTEGKDHRRIIALPNDFSGFSWSPDGKYIAVSSRCEKEDLYDSAVYLFPVKGGDYLRLTPPNGSYDWEPSFTKDGKYIVFVSNRDGWDHVYRMNPDGTGIKQLSRGNFEHESAIPSPDSKWVTYLRNVDGTRQLMKVPITGDEPVQLDSGNKGYYYIRDWTPDSRQVLVQFSSPHEPPGLWKVDAETGKSRQIVSSKVQGMRRTDFVTPERFSFTSRDGLKIHGYIIKPPNMKSGTKYPAVICAHGGPTWQFTYDWDPFMSFLAHEGYVICKVDIRGSTGYGVEFQKANDGEWGNKDLFDLVDAKNHLLSLGYVDPERVGIYGGSYGGYMVLCGMSRTPEDFVCGVALYGDSDIAESYRRGDRIGRIDLHREMGDPDENKEIYKRGSPVFYAENIQNPILIQHGRLDMRVVPLMSEMMIEKMRIESKFFEVHYFHDEGHGFRTPENKQKSYDLTFRFLEKYLKGTEDKKE